MGEVPLYTQDGLYEHENRCEQGGGCQHNSAPTPLAPQFHLTESVCKVVLQVSTPAQIRQRVLQITDINNQLADFCGNCLLQNDFISTLCKIKFPNLIRTSIHHEYDFPWGIGAIPSEMKLTAPMPWGGNVFMMNTRRD